MFETCLQGLALLDPYQRLKNFLKVTQKALQILNRSNFADLKQQQCLARVEMERNQISLLADPTNEELQQKERKAKDNYIKILSSVIDILRQ